VAKPPLTVIGRTKRWEDLLDNEEYTEFRHFSKTIIICDFGTSESQLLAFSAALIFPSRLGDNI
jgi:hypothetical protein